VNTEERERLAREWDEAKRLGWKHTENPADTALRKAGDAIAAALRQGAAGPDAMLAFWREKVSPYERRTFNAWVADLRTQEESRLTVGESVLLRLLDANALSAGAAPREPENVERPMTFQAFERQAREGGP
jgi:transposase